MSQIKIDSKDVAKIKNALAIILRVLFDTKQDNKILIVRQVGRIGGLLLPKIKYGKEKCLVYVDKQNQERKERKVKIIELKAENIKRIKAIEIKPKDNLVIISGKNDQGKSSVLDSIWYALSWGDGKKKTPRPIRKGEDKAQVRVDLGDIIVTRNWTGNEKSYLKVENKEGMQYKSPQQLLDRFMGKLSFDPLDFSRLNNKEQGETLLELVDLKVDLKELEEKKKTIYEERTLKNRELKTAQVQLEEMEEPEGTPEKEVSITSLSGKLESGIERNADIEDKLHSLSHTERQIDEDIGDIGKLRDRVEKNKEKMKAYRNWLKENKQVNIEEIRTEIYETDRVNKRIRAAKAFRGKETDIKKLSGERDGLSTKIEKLDSNKKEALEKADMPIKGLSVDKDGVTYKGFPFSQLSDSEQLKVSMAIAMAVNPKLKVIRVRDGSLLDEENMKIIREMANNNDFQIWIERVEEGEVGFIIEDGELKLSKEG